MSDSSRDNDSSGSHKSFKDRVQSKQRFDPADGINGLKKGLNHLSEKVKSKGNPLQGMFSSKAEGSVYSKGVRELDGYGYEKYNLDDDGGEIFISRVPERALFNDGEPLMVRATGGNFVGSNDNTSVQFSVEPQAQEDDVRNMFINVPRGTAMEKEFHATVGEVTDDGMVRPRPIDNSFLERMRAASAQTSRPASHIELEDDVPEADLDNSADAPVFLQIDDEDDALVEVPEMVAEEHVITEVPVEEPFVAEEPVAEQPASYSFLDRVSSARSRMRPNEFFIDDVEEPAEASEEEPEAEQDDYSWVKFDDEVDDEPVSDVPIIDAGQIQFTEAPVEEPIIMEPAEDLPEMEVFEEAPVVGFTELEEEPVTEEIGLAAEPEVPEFQFTEAPVEEPVFEAFEQVEEAPVEIPVEVPAEPVFEEPVVEMEVPEVQVEEVVTEVPVEIPMEVPAEEPVAEVQVEAPVEEVTVQEVVAEAPVEVPAEPVVMTLPGIREVEPLETIAGLEMEGSEPSSESAVEENVSAAPAIMEAAATSVEAAPAQTPRFNGLADDGESLPPLSDPVIKRPRSVRFRFSNGVLQNVDSEKPEPKEELHSPLD